MPKIGSCPYKNCRLNCQSEYHHRARYSYISQNWKNKVNVVDKEIKKQNTKSVKWNDLKRLGIIYTLKPDVIVNNDDP